MTGTGPFRSLSHTRGGPTPADEHLGDRLAAFVDGELRDDQRERVQAHLVTCPQCKAEADEQRRLKSAVAGAMPPAVSASLLARLQGLPGGGDQGGPGDGGDAGRGALGGDFLGPRGGLAGGRRGQSYLTSGRGSALGRPGEPGEGFPIHDVSRSASRGRRFAFAAAGAFSLAALALGGALPLDAIMEGTPPADPGTGAAAGRLGADTGATAGPAATGASGQVHPGVLTAPLSGLTPLSAARPLLSRQDDAPSPAGGLSPAPVAAISSALPAASATPEAVPATSPVAPSAYAVQPAPLPLLGTAAAQAVPGR